MLLCGFGTVASGHNLCSLIAVCQRNVQRICYRAAADTTRHRLIHTNASANPKRLLCLTERNQSVPCSSVWRSGARSASVCTQRNANRHTSSRANRSEDDFCVVFRHLRDQVACTVAKVSKRIFSNASTVLSRQRLVRLTVGSQKVPLCEIIRANFSEVVA